MKEVTTPEKIGELNKKLILEFVRKNGPVSRADIKRNLGMSFPSVSANVKSLLEIDYLQEVGEGDNNLGRPATLIEFNASRGYIVGADLGRSQIRVMVSDLQGNEIVSIKSDSSTKMKTNREIINQLKHTISTAVKKSGIASQRVKVICIGIPGVVDQGTGEVIIAPFFNAIKKDDMVAELTHDFKVPVLIENSVNYGAIGEKWRGAASGFHNIVYVDYGVGIGAAVIINGELFSGSNGMAGEVGFMALERANLRSQFDEQGVLETMISGNQITQALEDSGLTENVELLLKNYYAGDEASQLVIREIVDYFGMFLINTVAVLNPELVVVSGRLGSFFGEAFIPEWERMLANHVPCPPRIVPSKLASRANVFGAVAVGMRYINESIEAAL